MKVSVDKAEMSFKPSYSFPVFLGAVFTVATSIKVLLIPSYRSTDFEVHRNWLAVTHSLPVSRWYYEDTSPWTLDYPPFFAWFEWFLSQPATLLDPNIVNVTSLNYASLPCVIYQRITVMCSDLILPYAILQYYWFQVSVCGVSLASRRAGTLSLLILFNYGLFIVDHIHFQYNGFLLGMLLLSTVRIMEGRYLEGGFWFSVLLNFKHIFMYMAPAYFVFLLKHHCFQKKTSSDSSRLGGFLLANFMKLGSVVIAVFCLSFGPFLYLGQIQQVLSRLFPFKRGLCHAYWAPNVWALYSLADMLGAVTVNRLVDRASDAGSCGTEGCGSMTSGLVGEMSFKLLPNIPPLLTLLFTVLSMMPVLVRVLLRRCRSDFLEVLVLCAYSSFLFGWHVHEKAVLLIIIPMSVLVVEKVAYRGCFFLLSVAGHVSLFPLLYQPAETLIKLTLFVSCTCATCLLLSGHPARLVSSSATTGASASSCSSQPITTPSKDLASMQPTGDDEEHANLRLHPKEPHLPFDRLQCLCLALLLVAQVYCNGVHPFLSVLQRYQFLPLLFTSVSCALAIVLSWVQFYRITFSQYK